MSTGYWYWDPRFNTSWESLSNWNNSGDQPSEVPWSGQDGSTNNYDLVDARGIATTIGNTLTLDGGSGSCNVSWNNYGTINGGTFTGPSESYSGGGNNGTINGGTFTGRFQNWGGTINGGTFTYTNAGFYYGGTINGGTFEIDGFYWDGPSPNINFQNITTLSGGNPFTGFFYSNLYVNGVWSNQSSLVTLYYNNAQNDGDWGNILNWWVDSGFTLQAIALPTATNPINLYNEVTQNTQGADQCFCASASFWSANFGAGLTLQSTGVVNMQGSSVMDGYTTDGVSMHDSSTLTFTSVIDGNVVMRDSSRAFGYILRNAEINYDGGNGQYPIGGLVDGTVTYLGWPAVSPQWFNDQVAGGADDGDFSNKANWWTDNTYTTRPVNAVGTQGLPDASTDVFIAPNKAIYANTGTANPTINSLTADTAELAYISLTVSNGATFSGSEWGMYQATLYGNATFKTGSYNQYGVIHGTATYESAAGLQGAWNTNSLSNINIAGSYGSSGFAVNISGGGGGFISRLLNLPWFIKF